MFYFLLGDAISIFLVMYQTLARVFDHFSKHRERKFTERGTAEFFNETSFPYEQLRTWTRFETEAK